MSDFYYDSPCGLMRVSVSEGALRTIEWVKECPEGEWAVCLPKDTLPGDILQEDAAVLKTVVLQLEEYFGGKRCGFGLPLRTSGTEFQESVWRQLQKIPYGTTVSYSEVARRIGRPSAVRAVAHAVHCNPIGIVIPCHRVIAADGNLAGFAAGLEVKRFLLDLEQRNFFRTNRL